MFDFTPACDKDCVVVEKLIPPAIGFAVETLLISLSLTYSSFYESNTRCFLVSFLHIASNMFKKIEQRSTNVRKPLNLIFLTIVITSVFCS